jgi:glutathione synthase
VACFVLIYFFLIPPRYLIDRHELKEYQPDSLPPNPTIQKIPSAIACAWGLYNNKNAVVMMVIHPGETNTFDQRWIEYSLWEKYP